MALVTSQKIIKFYTAYKNIEITFNNHVINSTGLIPKQIHLKVLGIQIPCIIYSTSMIGAKLLANLNTKLFEKIREANNTVSLRFSFKNQEKADPILFFVSAKVTGFNPYNSQNPDTNFISLTYSQKPPDDLIRILGELLEFNINSKKRKKERIPLTESTMQKIGISSKDSFILIQGIPRKCIIRDISFSGAKVIIVGLAKFLLNKQVILKIEFKNLQGPIDIHGTIVRHEEVKGRKDIAAIAINYDESKVPTEYKKILHNILIKVYMGDVDILIKESLLFFNKTHRTSLPYILISAFLQKALVLYRKKYFRYIRR